MEKTKEGIEIDFSIKRSEIEDSYTLDMRVHLPREFLLKGEKKVLLEVIRRELEKQLGNVN